jgi:type I restriction enzyme S subunit
MKKYDSYKDSGVEWIGEIPSHWEVKRGKEVLKFSNGYPFNSGLFSMDENEGFPLVRIRDLKSDKITTFYKGEIVRDALIHDNDFIIGMDGDFNIVKWHKGKALLNQRLCKIEGVNHLETNYLSYSLPFYLKIINDLTYYTTVKHLSNNDLFEQKFLVPNSQEQTTIANYLDKKTTQIDHLIAKKEQFIQLLEEERVAVINQAVTKGLDPSVPMKDSGIEWLGEMPEHWEIAKVKRLSALISKGTTPSTVGKEVSDKGEIRYLKSENIVDNQLLNTPEFYIDNETNQILKRSILEINDVLIVIAGASIGKVAILTDDFYPSNTNQAVSFIRLKNPNSSCFVWYWLQSSYIKERISLDATQSAQPNLSMESIGNFYIPKISIEEEQDIMTFLTQKTKDIDVIISKTKQEIELLKEYKTALISEVVTGKVDVREAL